MSSFPKSVARPSSDDDIVQVLMTEQMARTFEERCLGPNASLVGPIVFSDDDVPTYMIAPS